MPFEHETRIETHVKQPLCTNTFPRRVHELTLGTVNTAPDMTSHDSPSVLDGAAVDAVLACSAPTWASACLKMCESFWARLDHFQAAKAELEQFVRLLGSQRHLRLAQMVIPELRKNVAVDTANASKAYIVATLEARSKPEHTAPSRSRSHEDPLYSEEKKIYLDAESQRAARLWLYGTTSLTVDQEAQIQDWLSCRPGPWIAGNEAAPTIT